MDVELPFEQVLELARAGDAWAIGRLFERYRAYLTVLAHVQVGRRLQGKVEAVDLVQETFLEAHRGLPGFRGSSEGELAAWLRQILAHTLAHVVRRYLGTKRRDVRLERQLTEQLDLSSEVLDGGLIAPGSSPSQGAVRRENAVLVCAALDELPEDYRQVLMLRHLEGLTFPDVARRMGRTVNSVEKLWTRALGRLRRTLRGAYEASG
jgi:RNA polymerase sigma-70 factor (ECF subfamily)